MWHCPHPAARLLVTAGPQPCSNRSISPGRRAHSSKPAAAACGGRMGQTDGRPTVAQTLLLILRGQLVLYLGFLSRGMYE